MPKAFLQALNKAGFAKGKKRVADKEKAFSNEGGYVDLPTGPAP